MTTEKRKEYEKEYKKEKLKLYKRLKICIYCSNKDIRTLSGRTVCFECAEKYAKRQHDKHYATEESIEKRKAYRKELRERHIQNHECTVCGKKLPDNYNYKSCSSCRAYNKIRQRKSDCFNRGEYGICWTCNKEKALVGKRVCEKCYIKMLPISLKNLEKARDRSYFAKGFVYGKKTNQK